MPRAPTVLGLAVRLWIPRPAQRWSGAECLQPPLGRRGTPLAPLEVSSRRRLSQANGLLLAVAETGPRLSGAWTGHVTIWIGNLS
jgi:hypothetical protein